MFVLSNGYIYFSHYCDDARARVSTGIKGVKDKESINMSVLKKSEELTLARIKDAALKFEESKRIAQEPVIKTDMEAIVKKSLGKVIKNTGDIKSDFFQMLADMRSGNMLKPKTKDRFSDASITGYDQMYRYLTDYCTEKGVVLTYNINTSWILQFISWLTQKDFSKNTISTVVGNIKTFFKYMHKAGKHANRIFEDDQLILSREEADTIALTVQEIETLYRLDLPPIEDAPRDVFIFACWVGLRKKDLRAINKYKLRGKVFDVLTHKTGAKVIIPVHWMAKEIYEKYDGKMPVFDTNSLNYHIKKICKKAGMTSPELVAMTTGGIKKAEYVERYKLASIHTARRSFATNAYKAGIKSIDIMKITGHKTESAFMKYIRIDKEENAQNLAEHPFFTGD
ncbi:site-specific recombinase XerD [Chitinophaga polysaccharea]|uniref:Site-specific recombinase XerD n=1 Tax=Chitinophaga polysaccharea TaxID=1293035 RepID=A0A561PL42_9BACT|nr:phage integrase SAM-like domain-containing protein [Chitinophaga polysaccharea]TWF38822.1 site-specific recombinase XerD [Chitinophaga polysaccharea]